MAEMAEQMVMLSRVVTQTGLLSGEKTAAVSSKLKVAKLTDQDDSEAFLVTFERLIEGYEVPKTRGAYKLATQLSDRAQQAYTAMPSETSGGYDEVGSAILRRYDIVEGTYQQRLKGEIPWETSTQLMDLAKKWT